MGIYDWYELGVWFESKLPISTVRTLLPKTAKLSENLTRVPSVFFVPCFQKDDSFLRGFNGLATEDEKTKLLQLWQHIKQTDGFIPQQISCVFHYASTYGCSIANKPITNIEYE